MSKENFFDDDDAVDYIRNYLPQDLKTKFSNDDIMYVIDLVYDYYDAIGALDADDDTTVEIDEDNLIDYVESNAQKDGLVKFDEGDVAFIVRGELDYCEKNHLFE